jgi:hypothetical protein
MLLVITNYHGILNIPNMKKFKNANYIIFKFYFYNNYSIHTVINY